MSKRTKIHWNSDKLLSLSAISISFITLMIFVYQTNLLRKQNYLSILPYLALSTSNNPMDYVYELNLKNHGVGPAIIESVTVSYKNKRYDLADFNDELHTCLASIEPTLDSIKVISFATLNSGLAIPANETYNILRIDNSQKEYELFTKGLEKLLANGLDYEIVFKSIQNERWRLHNSKHEPEKIR